MFMCVNSSAHFVRFIVFSLGSCVYCIYNEMQVCKLSLNLNVTLDLCLGTLTSITNLATSLARNMDRLSLDEEHYTRQEEWRRQLPESLGDGLRQGLSRLGISLLGL